MDTVEVYGSTGDEHRAVVLQQTFRADVNSHDAKYSLLVILEPISRLTKFKKRKLFLD